VKPQTNWLWGSLSFTLVLCCSQALAADQKTYPGAEWQRADPADVGLDGGLLGAARDYALTGEGSGYIIRHGKLVMAWGDPRALYDLKSTTKSIGVTALGIALADGRISLDDLAAQHHPEFGVPPASNADTGWLDEITIFHLATQTAGFEKPGGYQPLLFRPGTRWHYSDGGPNWLAECLTHIYGQDLAELLHQRVFATIGITAGDLRWRNNQYRPHDINGVARREFGSGISANVAAMARIGYLYLREGQWGEQQLIPADFVDRARTTPPQLQGLPEHVSTYDDASEHYGLLWWNNADGTLPDVPRTTFWSWGLYDSLIVVFPEFDIVVSRAGKSWNRKEGDRHYDVLAPFLQAITRSVQTGNDVGQTERADEGTGPYPPSDFIRKVTWAPRESIVRLARGSDNWPLTWADDDALYTAYGDGKGFEPFVPEKLSMGFAKVSGEPDDPRGSNIRSEGESKGDGAAGLKASGLLMIDGTLFLWLRNAGNSQLGWSADHAKTWTWADWKFNQSFGCPTFLNFGPNYAGARDEFVYIYSPDSDSAYNPADRMVLARVPRNRLTERAAYEFFVSMDSQGQPRWHRDIEKRGPVFVHAGNCYRGGVSYHPGLKRYLWCQILPQSRDQRGPRFEGGFGIYDAPEPWGPWTTVYFTRHWDVGPGETSSLPTKWFSADGKTGYLVFSGDDCFSVRQVEFALHPSRF
jgi:CubicO group peptidase (beta-lactamase class C family)